MQMQEKENTELENECYVGIYLLERYAKLLMSDKKKEAAGMLPRLTEMFAKVLPAVVEAYEREELKPWKAEQAYWPEQLQRITAAMESKDAFLLMDVFYCETRENLMQFMERAQELGIRL